MVSFAKKTVTRIRAGTITERGTEYPDWNNTNDRDIPGCCLTWRSTAMSQEGRVLGIENTRVLFAPLDADIQEGDRIKYRGETYEIDGGPKDWESPTGAIDHYEITLKRYKG